MGDPKFSRRQYDKPSHPWKLMRILEEKVIVRRYGLKNKKELWKAQSRVRRFRGHSRELLARLRYGDKQAEREREELVGRLARLGILPEGATLDDVLGLEVDAILSRRLQTVAYLKGLAYTPKQARKMIVHGHINVSDRKVTIPGYSVTRAEEAEVGYNKFSAMANDLHPARPDPEEIQARIEKREQDASRELETLKREGSSPRRRRRRGPGGRPPPRR